MIDLQRYRLRIMSVAVFASALQLASCGQETETAGVSEDTVIPDTTSAPVLSSIAAVSISSKSVQASVGDTFTLDIELEKFPATEGGGINIKYQPNVIHAARAEIDTAIWEFTTAEGVIDNNKGVITDILFSSYSGAEGNVPVVKITFKAVAVGNSDITVTESSKNPFASNGERVNPLFVSSRVTVR